MTAYEGWKKLKEQKVKSLDPFDYTLKNNRITYNGVTNDYYVEDNTANKIAEKNGGSPYAITVDIDRWHEAIFENHNGLWEPIKSFNVGVGGKIDGYNNGYCGSDGRMYIKNCLTPTGLFYINGTRWYGNIEDVIYWVAFGVPRRGEYEVDYLHSRKNDTDGTAGCVAAAPEIEKWIYYNCGRGTPILIW